MTDSRMNQFKHALEFHECPACGEKVFDREAMRKIQTHSPAFAAHALA